MYQTFLTIDNTLREISQNANVMLQQKVFTATLTVMFAMCHTLLQQMVKLQLLTYSSSSTRGGMCLVNAIASIWCQTT